MDEQEQAIEERTYSQEEVDALLADQREHAARLHEDALVEERNAAVRHAQREIAQAEASADRRVEKAQQVAEQKVSEAREAATKEIARHLENRADGYRMGIVDGNETALCAAVAPHTGVACQREPGHALGPYDRHKAIFGEPHEAVVWNE